MKKSEKIKALATFEHLLDSSAEMATALTVILTYAAQTEDSVVVSAKKPKPSGKVTPKVSGRGKAQVEDEDENLELDDEEAEDEDDGLGLDDEEEEEDDGELDLDDEEEEEPIKPSRRVKPTRATAKPATKPAASNVEYVKRMGAASIRMGWKRACKEGVAKKYADVGQTELKGLFAAINLDMANHYGDGSTRAEKVANAALSLSAIEKVTAFMTATFEKADILKAFDKIVNDTRPKTLKVAIAMMIDEAVAGQD